MTLFIKGNHEDFVWLDDQPNPEVLPGLFYLRNGTRLDATIDGVRSVVLNKAPHPGSLVAIEIGNRRKKMQVIGEWPIRGASERLD